MKQPKKQAARQGIIRWMWKWNDGTFGDPFYTVHHVYEEKPRSTSLSRGRYVRVRITEIQPNKDPLRITPSKKMRAKKFMMVGVTDSFGNVHLVRSDRPMRRGKR